MTARRLAVVTASTAGIGLSSAEALAKAGYHVIISSRKAENVRNAVSELQAKCGTDSVSGLVCHVARPDDRARLLAHALSKAPVVHALVLNAAVSSAFGPTLETTEAQWDKIFDINLKASFILVKDFAPCLSRGSCIVFVTSIAAYNPLPGLGAYSVSKTALLGLCKVLAGELADRGIRVNAVAPGIIRTKFSRLLWDGGNAVAVRAAAGIGEAANVFPIPLKRIGEPSDVSGVIAFLVSDQAAYITGEIIVMAGGAHSKL